MSQFLPHLALNKFHPPFFFFEEGRSGFMHPMSSALIIYHPSLFGNDEQYCVIDSSCDAEGNCMCILNVRNIYIFSINVNIINVICNIRNSSPIIKNVIIYLTNVIPNLYVDLDPFFIINIV